MNATLEQIKKLLSLANDSAATPGEIQAAMGRVAHLAAKHNISDVEIEKATRADGSVGVRINVNPADMVDEVVFTAANMGRWDKWLGSAIQEATNAGCYIGWCRTEAKTAIRFYGLPQDVAVARELFAFARKSLSRAARQWKRDEGRQVRPVEVRTFKDGFCRGLIEAAKALTEEPTEKAEVATEGSTALVLVTDLNEAKQAALVVKKRELGLTTGRACGARTWGGSDAHSAGTAAGRATNLSRNAIA
jgi:hypothetical protein